MEALIQFTEQFRTLANKSFPLLQDEAMQHFNRLGFPDSKNEEWKFTNISPLVNKEYSWNLPRFRANKKDLETRFPFLKEVLVILIENGKLNESESDLNDLPAGISIHSLLEKKSDPRILNHYGRYADTHADAFAALNTAFSNDGIVIWSTKVARIKIPVVVLNVSYAKEESLISHNRILIVAEKNSEAAISLLNISLDAQSETFSNQVIEIVTAENSKLELNILQDENKNAFHICNTYVHQEKHSVFNVNTISTGGRITRNKLHIRLDDIHCETHLYGLYIAGGDQLIDNHTAVFHAQPHCSSNQLYKGIIGGRAHGVFNGKIIVERQAQKTIAYQSNKNILLSNDAVINAKPQLEIFADDVKCTHGATTGQMDDHALFYLRSRGIPEADAKAMLNLAFAQDVINHISGESLRRHTTHYVEQKLKSLFD